MTQTSGTGTHSPVPRSCASHPDRAPVGLCRKCDSPVCAECHVRLDGIIHCRGCLAVEARTLAKRRNPVLPRLVTAVAAVALLVPALLGVRVLLLVGGTAASNVSRLFASAPESPQEQVRPR